MIVMTIITTAIDSNESAKNIDALYYSVIIDKNQLFFHRREDLGGRKPTIDVSWNTQDWGKLPPPPPNSFLLSLVGSIL